MSPACLQHNQGVKSNTEPQHLFAASSDSSNKHENASLASPIVLIQFPANIAHRRANKSVLREQKGVIRQFMLGHGQAQKLEEAGVCSGKHRKVEGHLISTSSTRRFILFDASCSSLNLCQHLLLRFSLSIQAHGRAENSRSAFTPMK